MPKLVSMDPAQAVDWAGLSICDIKLWITPDGELQRDQQGNPMVALDCVWLDRKRGLNYDDLARLLTDLLHTPQLEDDVAMLVLDNSGVGRALGDILAREDLGTFQVEGITIPTILQRITYTGQGVKENSQGGNHMTVPKTNIIGAGLTMLNQGRLRISPSLPLAPVVEKEFKSYRTKITVNHDHVYINQDSEHDDLLSALCQSCLVCQRRWGVKHFGDLMSLRPELDKQEQRDQDNESNYRKTWEAVRAGRLKLESLSIEDRHAYDYIEMLEKKKRERYRACWDDEEGDDEWLREG